MEKTGKNKKKKEKRGKKEGIFIVFFDVIFGQNATLLTLADREHRKDMGLFWLFSVPKSGVIISGRVGFGSLLGRFWVFLGFFQESARGRAGTGRDRVLGTGDQF